MLRGMADAEAWSKRVAEWRASGLTAKEFCAKHDLQLSGLRNWSYRLRAAEKAAEASAVRLVPVTVNAEGAPPPTHIERAKPAVTIELGAARIVVPAGADCATLKMVLDVLGEQATRGTR
jgi:transposase